MGVELNKDKFKDSNDTWYELRELENYDFSNDWGWECKEYCKITDIYKKTFFDVAITLSYYTYFSAVDDEDDLMGIGKKYAEYCQWLLRKDRKQKDRTIEPKTLLTIPDPDSESPLLQEIYKKLWNDKDSNDKYLKECKDSKNIKGETMNSIWTTLNEAYKFIKKQKDEGNKEENASKKYLLCRYAESMLNGKFVSELDKIRGLRTFLESAHRLGNFIPVPVGCNSPRGTGTLKDYWDLTLKVIYDYYTFKEVYKADPEYHGNICKIVGAENVDKYKAWLDSFENWDNFVRKNYMRAFVQTEEDGHYGKPKELWDGHFSGAVLPEDIGQAEQFFERASFCIHERSLDMIDELKKRL